MAKRTETHDDLSVDQLMYPDCPPRIEAISITRQALKNGELKCELQAVTNVPNLAALTPEAWTNALFGFLFEMHRGDYDHFRNSCTSAVSAIKDQINSRMEASH